LIADELPGFLAEVPLHPDVGPALFAVGCASVALVHAPFEAIPSSLGIGGGGFGLAEEFAEVEKVLLAGGPFLEIDGLPLGDEFLRCHALFRTGRSGREKGAAILGW
jgi:hypothetical protein